MSKQHQSVKREDPPSRPLEQLAERASLENADPTKHYVYVSELSDPTLNVGYYKSLGYKISQYDPNEAKPLVGYSEYQQGDAIKANGCVLMECPMEVKQALDRKGWAAADRIQDTIKRRDLDPEEERVRGIKSVRADGDNRTIWEF